MADPRITTPESPEERLRKLGIAIYQNEQIIKSAKPGSAQFKKAQKNLEGLRKAFDEANAEVNALRAGAKKAAADKAKAKAQEDLERAEALGDEERAQKARDKIKKAEQAAAESGTKTYNQQREEDIAASGAKGYTGTGTKDKPLQLGGEPFSGTYKGKKYENGILVATPPKTGSGTGTGTGTGTGDGDGKGKDDKTKWVSYLRLVFKTVENKEEKAQIDVLFDKAIQQNWDENKFMENLKGTKWWQSNFASFRQFFLESRDPRNAGTFAEKVKNNIDSITAKIEALGIAPRSVDPVTGKVIDNSPFMESVALEAIKNNWTDDQLENYLSTKSNIIFTGGGTIGSYLDRVKSTAYLYGVKLDANMEKSINTSLLDPLDGRDYNYWINSMKQMAIDAPENKPFAESLKAGRSLYEVTASYRNQMASLLEVDSTAITWDDLMGKIVDGTTNNARTFADFTKALKQDPLWQYTRNAKETYSGMALDLAKMFGFAG